jgi:hypothetical protein
VVLFNLLPAAAAVFALGLASAAVAEAQDRAGLNRSTDGLYEVQGGPVEGDRVDLQGRFQSFLVVTKDADGNLEIGCQDEHPHESHAEHAEVAE